MYSCNHIFKIFCVQASRKNAEFNFLDTNLPKKMDLGVEFQKTNLRIRISILEIITLSLSFFLCVYMCVSSIFQAKQMTSTFSAQICQKVDLGLEIQNADVGIRISILKTLFVPIFSKNG